MIHRTRQWQRYAEHHTCWMLCADTISLLQETIKQQNLQTTFRIVDETIELEKIITIKKDKNKKWTRLVFPKD